jgi:hypothetical protein
MRLMFICFIAIVVITAIITAFIPQPQPNITYSQPTSDYMFDSTLAEPEQELPEPPMQQTNNYEHGYQQGYLDRQDEIDYE